MSRAAVASVVLAALAGVAGCDMLGIDTPERVAGLRDADGKAIGGACRHAGRAIEDCYRLYRKADRAAIYAGWREMNDYMRENKIDEIVPKLVPAPAPAPAVAGGEAAAPADPAPAEAAPKS